MAELTNKSPQVLSCLTGMNTGTYVLILQLSHHRMIRIGKLGSFIFPAGYYAYIGSAFGPGGLSARIMRHLNTTKNFHWHIDYLRQYAQIREIWISQQNKKLEHLWASMVQNHSDSSVPVPGFGCTDCTCTTHLFHFDDLPSYQRFCRDAKRVSPGQSSPVRIRT